MGIIKSNDYRDYVIKDDKFIGAFEEMYRDCPDPWHQDELPPLAEDIALLLLSKRRYQRVLDIGCGKGRFTSRVKATTGASVTACTPMMLPVPDLVPEYQHGNLKEKVGNSAILSDQENLK